MTELPADRRTHVVQVRVSYQQIQSPYTEEDRRPVERIELIVTPPPEGVDLDALRGRVEAVAGGPDFLLDQNVHHHSWGADATVVEFVLAAATSGVIGGAAWDALRALGRSIVHRRSELPSGEPIGEREAKSWARQLAVRRFDDLSDADLGEVVAIELRDATATVVFDTGEGSTVTVDLELVDGLIALGSAKRDLPQP